jgi:hypothetical protein
MYNTVDFFRHDWHTSVNGANLKCYDCHKQGASKSAGSAKKCTGCHSSYKNVLNAKNANKKYYILSYTDALHNLCVSCHLKKAKELKDKPDLARCSTCHKTELPENLTAGIEWKITVPHFNSVILPDVKPVVMETK